MALNDIPVLSADHPLYDWSDHQSSRDALVSGTPTQYFAKEAWNAIVDSLSDALTAAGLEWDDTYTTAEGAKITAAYGPLSAQAFNSVRHNIESPAPLGWQWAFNPDFRGYVGREDFRGRATHKNKSDDVYPEYIIELARKLNLLIEIMRGTALLAEVEAKQLSTVKVLADVLSKHAAYVAATCMTGMEVSAEARAGKAAYVASEIAVSCKSSADVLAKKSAPASAYLDISSLQACSGRTIRSLPLEPERVLIKSLEQGEVIGGIRPRWTSASVLVASRQNVEANRTPSYPIEAQAVMGSSGKATVVKEKSRPLDAHTIVKSRANVLAEKLPSSPTKAEALLRSLVQASVEGGRMRDTGAQNLSASKVACSIGTAWLPPVWVNGGLWIRQVHDAPVQREDGSLEVT